MKSPTRLNKKIIDGLPELPKGEKSCFIRDAVVRGLILSVNRRSKSWRIQWDLYRDGKFVRSVKRTIGSWPDMDVDTARATAQEVIALIKRGIDPNAPPQVTAVRDSVRNWTLTRLYEEYAADLRKRGAKDRTPDEMIFRLNSYLGDWKERTISSLTKAECRARHDSITQKIAEKYKHHQGKKKNYDGKRTANHVLKELKWAFNFAATLCEDDEVIGNPVSAVSMHKQRAANKSVAFDEMPDWWGKVQKLPNPLRRNMHTLGLLSGLRPGALVAIQREWVNLDKQVITIPHTHMKSDEPFALPLSKYMCDVVRNAATIGDMIFDKPVWLFPTLAKDRETVIPTRVWKEKSLPSETGHILRHTYRTIAETINIPPTHRRLLLDHALGGMDNVYVDKRRLFEDLLASQELMTVKILQLCNVPTPTARAAEGLAHAA